MCGVEETKVAMEGVLCKHVVPGRDLSLHRSGKN